MMTDYIKREDAMVAYANHEVDIRQGKFDDYHQYMRNVLRSVESADVAPIRRGHWIYDCCDIVCSECGTAFSDEVCYMMRGDESYHEPKHCPWCGAEMSEENER